MNGPPQLRDVLLGHGTHFADPRVATDTLDDLVSLIDELDDPARLVASRDLARLVTDQDVVVATGAALAVGRLGRAADLDALLDRVRDADPAMDRTPIGFAAVSQPSVRAELACGLASLLRPGDEAIATALADELAHGVDRATIVAGFAAQLPDLVVARARDWLDATSATRTGVLARLARQWHRLAVAGALRPWPPEAADAIRRAGSWQRWDDRDTELLLQVMAEEAPELTRPEGIVDGRRWWIVAGEAWSWALWCAQDGAMALEVLRAGPSSTCATVLLGDEQADAVRRGGIGALDDLVTALRDT